MTQKDFRRQEIGEAWATVGRFIGEMLYDLHSPAVVIAAPRKKVADPADADLLTREEAAKELRCSPTTITRYRRQKILLPVPRLLPGLVRYAREDVERVKKRLK